MARFVKSILVASVLAVSGSAAMAADDPAQMCDAMAGSPDDLDLPSDVAGVAYADLDPSDAVAEACQAAIDAHPNERRFHTHMGRIYSKRGDYGRAVEAYRLAHGQGSAVASNNLGSMYMSGEGVVASEERATLYIRRAANRGLPFAMVTMGARARTGRGMPENPRMAVYWYERALEAGDAGAANDLGVMYQTGMGVREDDARAMDLFAEALRRDPGHALAAYNIAQAYEAGEGVPADLGWARGYYVLAFEAGDADAAAEVGRFHAEGLGTVADPAMAAEWYALGAAGGSLSATVILADAYVEGTGVEADVEKARTLFVSALDLDPNDTWRAYIEERLIALPLPEAAPQAAE